MLKISPIPAFEDNYIWLLQNGAHAVVIDPGDATPVLAALKEQSLKLDAILITHHHSDHIGGVRDLLANDANTIVYAPAKEQFDFAHNRVKESDEIALPSISLNLKVMEVPGHTLGHVAYYDEYSLFCGDTLFGAGCGRLFEGTPLQMHQSLQRLAKLPSDIDVYCTHEYTAHNIRFALTVDSENQSLLQRQQETRSARKSGLPTLPSKLSLELATNPFLRCGDMSLKNTINMPNANEIEVFTKIREMRNHF
ncbi:MAG: hydroxyacylglutathione hydrolase [Methylophilaceae bacterium]|nr:hydroxyacylglutathione hydrolase [Methyloradius sp.]